jgi:hypothetical protein
MLGQQSTAEFQGLHIDPLVIGRLNSLKQGPEIKRKSGMIVNTGGKPTREELKRKIQENKEKYVFISALLRNQGRALMFKSAQF